MHYDLVIYNAKIATCNRQGDIFEQATVAIHNAQIMLITSEKSQLYAHQILDAKGHLLTPGLIDCHTHLVYAGDRADEFALRLQGASYADIANQGGGILSTVKATRNATVQALTETAVARAKIMLKHGTTTVEIKSGYGLDLETEIKILTVAQSLEKMLPIQVFSTFLGAHTTPPEYQNNTEGYLDYLITRVLPAVARGKHAQFVDAFCEKIAFSPTQVERLFQAALTYGFKLKLHAEQLTDQKGAVLAAHYQACSVDHLEYLTEKDCAKLANQKTTAVLLPGAYYFLKETHPPPIAALRHHHIPIAIATDANPGTSPFLTLPLMMNMACVLFGLSIDEAWQAVTLNAAKALDISDQLGSIEIGKQADLILWSTPNRNDIVYNPSINFCHQIIKKGKIIKDLS